MSGIETSSGNPIAPGPSSLTSGGIVINPRTLVMALALFAGSGGAGGAVSLLQKAELPPATQVQITQTAEDSAAARQLAEQLATKLETVAVSVIDVKAEVRGGKKDISRLELADRDFETRIRALERRLGRGR